MAKAASYYEYRCAGRNRQTLVCLGGVAVLLGPAAVAGASVTIFLAWLGATGMLAWHVAANPAPGTRIGGQSWFTYREWRRTRVSLSQIASVEIRSRRHRADRVTLLLRDQARITLPSAGLPSTATLTALLHQRDIPVEIL